MIKKIRITLSEKKFNKYRIFLLINLFNFFLEFISLSSIPIFVASIASPDLLINKIDFINEKFNYNFKFDSYLIQYSAALVCFTFYLKNLFLGITIFFENKFYKVVKEDLKKSFFDYYVKMPYLEHTNINPAEMVRNTLIDIDGAVAYMENINTMLRGLMALIVILFLMVIVNKINAFIIFIFFLLLLLIYLRKIKPKIRFWASRNQKISKTLIKILYETFGSIKDIKILSKEDEVNSRFSERIHEYEKNNFFTQLTKKLPRIILEIITITILVLISLIYLMFTNDIKNLFSLLSVYAVLAVRFIPAFNSVVAGYGYLRIHLPRLENVANEVKKIKDSKIFKAKEIEYKSFNKNFEKDYLYIDNISFTYPNGKLKSLNNISFSIPQGTIVGISGPTGSGKTTLFHSLLGLVYPQKGNIFFKGKSIFKNINDWRKETGHISQNIFLLDDSIRKNISFDLIGNQENKENLEQVIEIAQLKDKVSQLSNGIDTKVGVDGLQLSGGERQRVAIARTLYKNPNIIFMDESTSALDEKTEELILSKLIETYKGKTIIIVTHRMKTLKYCDKTYTLHKGILKEST